MAEKSGFFNSVNGDRKYKADFFAQYFASFIGNGVFPNPSTGLQVIADTDMNIILKAGKAWINGYYYSNDSDLNLTLDTADGVLNRIDKIVLQFNTLNRIITAKIKKGSFASNAVAPVLQRDSNAHELALADIYVDKGILSITQANITDLRLDNAKCGIVHGTVDQVDTTTLFNQYQAWLNEKKSQYDADITTWTNAKKTEYDDWFNSTTAADQAEFGDWFNGVKGIFAGDPVGNLTTKVDTMPVFQTAGGTANSITLTELNFVNGYSKTFIIAADNEGIATTINGKPLYKPNTTSTPTLKNGKAVTIWYDLGKDCFFLKASAEGNTIAAHVLAGDIFSNDVDTGLVGTMVDNGEVIITPAATFKTIPQGYHNGAGIVATDSNLITGNIKSGITIFGVSGKSSVVETSDGTATVGQMLSGSTAYVNGAKIIGNITSRAAATITPTTSNQTISANQYLAGVQTILGDTDLIASNILNGVSIFGVAGNVTIESLGGRRVAYGTTRSQTLSLSFTPDIVIVYLCDKVDVDNFSTGVVVRWIVHETSTGIDYSIRDAGGNANAYSVWNGNITINGGTVTLANTSIYNNYRYIAIE